MCECLLECPHTEDTLRPLWPVQTGVRVPINHRPWPAAVWRESALFISQHASWSVSALCSAYCECSPDHGWFDHSSFPKCVLAPSALMSTLSCTSAVNQRAVKWNSSYLEGRPNAVLSSRCMLGRDSRLCIATHPDSRNFPNEAEFPRYDKRG